MKKQEKDEKSKFNPFVLRRKWNNKRIAMVAMLIATSVAFVLIFTRIIPVTAMPTMKISIGGLPIKITGYIFGPIIGAVTGALSDLISFVFLPTFYHPIYTLAFALAGFIPGIFGYVMHRRWKYKEAANPEDEHEYNDTNMLVTMVVILIAVIAIGAFVYSPIADFKDAIITQRNIFFIIAISGSVSMMLVVLIGRFVFKPKTYNALLPIIAFSAILDIINTPVVTWGDFEALGYDDGATSYVSVLTPHIIWTPIKSWGNMFIILFAYKITSPLIFNKTSNSWETELTVIDPVKNTKATLKEAQKLVEDNLIRGKFIKKRLEKRKKKKALKEKKEK